MLILRKPWESQPQVVPSIDWSNALCRGLVFCAVPFGTTMMDVVTGVAGTRTGAMTVRPSSTNGGKSRNGDGIGIAATGTSSDQIVWPVSLARGGSITSTGTVLALGGTTEQVDGKIYIFGGNTETVTAGDGFSVGIDSFSYLGRGNVTRHRFASALGSAGASGGSEVVGNPFNDRVHFFGFGFTANGANGTWFANRGGSTWSGGTVFGTTTTNRRALVHTSGDGRTDNSKNAFVNLFLIWDRELSVAEYQALYDNPWQLFESLALVVPSAAAGGDASVTLIGAAGTTAAGTVTATGGATVTLTGASATASAGTVTASAATIAAITGAGATSGAGTVEATGTAVVTLTGVGATGSAGTVSATADNTAIAEITGASATGSAGTISVAASSLIVLTGAQAIGYAGYVTATNGLVEDALVSGDDGDSGRYIGSKRHQADIERRNQRIIQITAALVASGVLQ